MSLDTESWVRYIHIGLCREFTTAIINFDSLDLCLVIDLQKKLKINTKYAMETADHKFILTFQ